MFLSQRCGVNRLDSALTQHTQGVARSVRKEDNKHSEILFTASRRPFFTCGSQDAGLVAVGSLLLLNLTKAQKKAETRLVTPENWHKGAPDGEKGEFVIKIGHKGRYKAKKAKTDGVSTLLEHPKYGCSHKVLFLAFSIN